MTMGSSHSSSTGPFIINLVIRSLLGLMAFCWLIHLPGLSAQDWDSESFVKDLDELKNDTQLKGRKVEDSEWAEYLNELEPEYDEKGFPEVSTLNPDDSIFAQKLNWSLTGRGEVPYLAIIYQFIEGEDEGDQGAMWGVVPHRACGGVLVSTERLITNCACVATYFANFVYPDQENADVGKRSEMDYNLGYKTPGKFLQNGKLNRIYVQFGSNRFFTGKTMPGLNDSVNDRHLVDGTEKGTDVPKVTLEQECADLVKNSFFHGQRPTKRERQFLNALALVPFWEPIRYPAPGQFVPWPPFVFNDHATQQKMIKNPSLPLEQVIVTGIGFRKVSSNACKKEWKLLDDEGEEMPLHKQAINLPYKHCTNVRDPFTCRGITTDDKYFKLSCFCDLYQPDEIGATGCKTVGYGVLGWPIIFQGNVVALTASERNVSSKGNPILGSSLAHTRLKEHVEKVLTKEKIIKQRTERPPLWREELAAESYVFYDYPEQPQWFVHEGTTPKLIPLNLSVRFAPHTAPSIVAALTAYLIYV